MTTEEEAEQASRQEEGELRIIPQSAQVLAELVMRIGSHFRRAEVRKRVGRYLYRLLARDRAQERLANGRGTGRSERARSAAEALRSRLG